MTVPPADTQEALDAHYCPICDVRFEADDRCATDIELGTCHATCLEGSPTVDLETGEPIDGPIETYPYSGAYNGSSLLSDPIDRVTTSSGGREAEASPPLATTRAPGEGEAVKVLDLSNLLKHAFDYGMATSGGTASQIADWWPTYDPEDCPAFNRIKSALAGPSYAQPAPACEAIADAVLGWMVKFDLLDADNEYNADDVLSVLNDLAPVRQPPAQPAPSDAMVEVALKIFNGGLVQVPDSTNARGFRIAYRPAEAMQAALAALAQTAPGTEIDTHKGDDRDAFKAGWWTNAAYDQPAAFLEECETVDWNEYQRVGLDDYVSTLIQSARDTADAQPAPQTAPGTAQPAPRADLVERLDGLDPEESIGAFGGSGQWIDVMSVAELRAALSEAPRCRTCKGSGTCADYVGDDMRCVEVECHTCLGKGALSEAPREAEGASDEIEPYEWLAQEFDRLAILRKMWTADEVAATIRRLKIPSTAAPKRED